MKHLFVPYEIAVALKEKGFSEITFSAYNKDSHDFIITNWDEVESNDDILIPENFNSDENHWLVSAPLYQQVVDWFREKHKINLDIASYSRTSDSTGMFSYTAIINRHYNRQEIQDSFLTYYEALDKAIEEALKLI